MENVIGSPSPATKTDHAIQDLIKSCRGLLPDGSNSQSQSLRFIDVQHACDELLKLTFHSEDGRLQAIEKLTKLDGNFVVKIIRKGLVSLSKVYSDSKTFEDESLKLVDLCCSQAESLNNGCGRQLQGRNQRGDPGGPGSPSFIVFAFFLVCGFFCLPSFWFAVFLVGGFLCWRSFWLAVLWVGRSFGWSFFCIAVFLVGCSFGWPFFWLVVFLVCRFFSWLFFWLAVLLVDRSFGWLFFSFAVCLVGCSFGWPFFWLVVLLFCRFFCWPLFWLAVFWVGFFFGWPFSGWPFFWLANLLIDVCLSQNPGYVSELASPAVIVDWTVALCDELLKPKEVSSGPPVVLMSRCLSKLRDIFETIVRARIFLDSTKTSGEPVSIGNFKILFETLIPRIQYEGFEELIEQTVAIIKTDENLDFLKLSRINGLKQAMILSLWKDLLKVSFLPNWFVVEVAKHDFLVHDDSYAKNLPFSDYMTYTESLVHEVGTVISSLVEEKEFLCSRDKAKIFFEYSEVFLRHPSLCLQLMQSKEVSMNLIKDLFFALGIKFDRALLPVPANSDLEDCDFEVSPDINTTIAQAESLKEKNQRRSAHHALTFERCYEKSSFDAITKALLTLPDKQQVLNVVQLWKRSFPDDTSYLMLSQLLALVKVVIEGEKESISSNMEHLVSFLSRDLPTECLSNLSLWQPLLVHLIPSLPQSWYGPEVISLIKSLINSATDSSSGAADQIIPNFVLNSLQSASKSEEVKIELLKLALELFEEVPDPEEYRFVLNVIPYVASDMESIGIKTFTLSLLKTARIHITRLQYPKIWEVISLIDQSRGIQRKSEVFQSYLKLLQEINHDDIIGAVNICSKFLQIPAAVDTDSIQRFFAVAAQGRLKTCQFILRCLDFNQKILAEDSRVDKHVIFLFTIIEKTLSRESCEVFFESVYRYMKLQILSFPNIDIFENILASIAENIAVNTFVSNRFGAVLRVVQAAVHTHQIDPPNAHDFLLFSDNVTQTIDKAYCFGKKTGFAECFANGLCLIAKLPLKLPQIIQLMEKVTLFLEQEKITDEQKVSNVMFHLFQLPSNESASSLDSEVLDLHFKEVVKPCIVRNVAEITLMQKQDTTGNVSYFSLMEVLVERMPETFAKKTSSSLYQYIIERVERNPQLSCSIFPIVEAITKRCVSEAKLKEEIEEIEEMLLRIPPDFIPLISECLRKCYIVGLSGEEQSIKGLIIQILESLRQSHLNVEDGCRMIGSILDIPKQLVLTFKEATSPDEARMGMTRIFDVVKTLDPEFITGSFLCFQSCFSAQPGVNDQLRYFIQRDFYMLLKHTSLAADDLSTAMLVYRTLKPENLLNVFKLSTNEDFNSLFEQWSSDTNQPQVPTPGYMAYFVMQHLRRLKVPDNVIQDTTLRICCTILGNRCFSYSGQMAMGFTRSHSPKGYLDLIISVMKESSHLAEIQHWLKMDCFLAVQCKDVIKATCFWKAGSKSCEKAMHMNTAVSETISTLRTKFFLMALPFTEVNLAKKLEVMALVIKTYEDEDIAVKLFELLCTSTECAEACVDVVLTWSKEEGLLLINKITDWYKERRQTETNLEQLNHVIRIPLQVLSFAAKAFPNSAEEVFNFLTKTTNNKGPEDHMSLGRLLVWYKKMTDAGYDPQAIQSWCTSFVLTQNLCSSDVDSLANLTPETINLLTAEPESNQIQKCLFCLEATQHLLTDKDAFKRCLLLARLLNEFACIAGQLKENLQVVERIQEGVGDLCSTFIDDVNEMGILYKIRYKILEDLFVLLFEGENGEHVESLRQLTSKGPLSKSLVILFRRLARSVVSRPVTFGHIKSVVTTMLYHNAKDTDRQYQEIKNANHLEVLHFESNQDAIHTLQAAGYNQSASKHEDLWYSLSIQMPAYVPTVKSFESSRKESLLRQLWREWRTILTAHDISEVEVSGRKLKQAELFKMSDSLETMEIQLQSVQQSIQVKPLLIMQNYWSYYRQKQLLRREKRLREKVMEQVKEVEEMTGVELTKMVIVWENQLLESVKMCSEKIPDCYAPNGFHSEKPVICGIAVDNRILTLYKEDKGGTRTEVENVEVKLYPAGMVVFGAYRSIHPYDTEQLWAAFYKMLLDKRLVPKIFITNVSPAFDWIKQFVAPEESSPPGINFISCCNLIPSSEDYFDYDPERQLLAFHAVFRSSQTKELIILTPENTENMKIHSIRAPVANRKTLIKNYEEEVRLHLEEDTKLQEMHPVSSDREKIIKRLRTPITKAVGISIDGGELTEESISRSIDIKRLLPNRSQDTHQYSKDDYCAVILDAVDTVTGDWRGGRQSYDGCQHVAFAANTITKSD